MTLDTATLCEHLPAIDHEVTLGQSHQSTPDGRTAHLSNGLNIAQFERPYIVASSLDRLLHSIRG